MKTREQRIKAARRANAADIVLAFNRAQSNVNADLNESDSREKHARDLYEQCRLEAEQEAQEAKVAEVRKFEDSIGLTAIRQADQAYDEQMGKRWRHSCADIKSMVDIMPQAYQFKLHNLPLISSEGFENVSFEQFRKAFHDFLTMKHETEGLTLDDESKEKLGLFIAVQANMFKDQAEGVDPLATGTFEDCLYHLERWNALNVKRTAQPRIEPTVNEISDRTTKEQDEQILGEQFLATSSEWLNAWAENVRVNWGITMTTDQKRKALDYIVNRGLRWDLHQSWDDARVFLANENILVRPDGTLPLTERESILKQMDKLDLAVPSQKREYFRLSNYLNYGLTETL